MDDLPAPLPFPKDPRAVLAEHGEKWMRMKGVRGVGLFWRDEELKFVIMIDDPELAKQVPEVIGGYRTSVEASRAKAAGATLRRG